MATVEANVRKSRNNSFYLSARATLLGPVNFSPSSRNAAHDCAFNFRRLCVLFPGRKLRGPLKNRRRTCVRALFRSEIFWNFYRRQSATGVHQFFAVDSQIFNRHLPPISPPIDCSDEGMVQIFQRVINGPNEKDQNRPS
uniref:Uncharacterized protein n=1 Tax=Romanomermis culicivorax TaxID=13658 RepID=A0A915JBD4_ROMCU